MTTTDNTGSSLPLTDTTLTPQRAFLAALLFVGATMLLAVPLKPYVAKWMQPNVAAEARRYLQEKDVRPLSEDLRVLLSDKGAPPIPTQNHPLIGIQAPGFTLSDDLGNPTSLDDQLRHGCVVLVFYYGYHCNHCVGQLFAVHDDLSKFQELNATVLAVSADPIEDTKARFEEYGRFGFTVLSDPGNHVAATYGVFKPATDSEPESLVHGTFVIAPDGRVTWCNLGDEPFTNNRTLLIEIAKASQVRTMTKTDGTAR